MQYINNLCLLISTAVILTLTACGQSTNDTNNSTPDESPVGVVHADWTKNMVVYEVNVRNFSEGGTFKEFEEHLPRLKEMGVTTLWFMPVHPIATKRIKGSLGSPYAGKDFESINPRMGTMEDFKSLVKKIHEMEMYVLIEWVANHTGWDHNLTVTNPDWYLKDSSGNFIPPRPDWEDVIELDYDNEALWSYMQNEILRWVEETDIDGFRFDVAGMMPTRFWEELRPKLDQIKPLFVFTDGTEIELTEKALDMVYDYEILEVMEAIAREESGTSELKEFLQNEDREFPDGAYNFYFTSGHVPNSFQGTVYERYGKAAPLFAVLAATLHGVPLVYSGQEAGLDKRLEFFEKDLIDWKEHEMYEIYKKLFHLRKDNQALWAGEFGGKLEWLSSSEDHSIFAFKRKVDQDEIIVVLNFSNSPKNVLVAGGSGKYTELFSGEEINMEGNDQLTLDGWGYQVLVK